MKRLVAILIAVVLAAAACDVSDVVVTPETGEINEGPTVEVSGQRPEYAAPGGTVTVNGVAVPTNADDTWTTTVPASSGLTTDIVAIYTAPSGTEFRTRRAVVNGPAVEPGEYSTEGVGMRFTNTGLDNLGPVINALAGGAFDIGGLLLAQNPLIDADNVFLTFDVYGNAYEAGIGGAEVTAQSTATGVDTTITVSDLYIGVDLNISDGLAIDTDCQLELQIPTTTILNTFDFAPSAADPTAVDVNLVGSPTVSTSGVDYEFISGICDGDTFLLGDIINGLAGGQIAALIDDGFNSQLGDPDGSGPLDSPVAGAIETALAEISIAGAVGEAIKVNLDAPFSAIDETPDAIDFRADADFFTTLGTGPTDCPAVAHAPALSSTYDVPGSFPALAATTPSGDPYGLGLTVSSAAFNQLLGAMTECGLLNQEVTEFDLGGGAPLPLTSTLLAGFIPAFGTAVPADTPITIRVVPTSGPFLTDGTGPNGETGELVLANLLLQFKDGRPGLEEHSWLELAVDAPLGFELGVDPVTEQLSPTISAPPGTSVATRVVRNGLNTAEAPVEAIFSNLFPLFVSGLSDSFAAFPLPGFLGLELDVTEVGRDGNYWTLYANLEPVLETRLENVTVTDLSSADGVVDSAFDVNEWRHRIRPTTTPTSVAVDYKGMIGADACCTFEDEDRVATAAYRVSMDVIPENGDSWQLDLSHLINGAHTLFDEKVALEDAGGETRFLTGVNGRVKVGDGAWQSFNFNPSTMAVVHGLYGGEGNSNVGFTGSAARTVSGSVAQTVTVEFSTNLRAYSNSNTFFPAAGGDEVALRFGANDTIANGFTAGAYPGAGNRSLLDDGWKSSIVLTAIPAP